FWIGEADTEGKKHKHRIGNIGFHHYAFELGSRAEVDQLGAFVRKLGAKIVDPPGEYYEDYYAVFFLDPDGFKLEGMKYGEQKRQRAAKRAHGKRGRRKRRKGTGCPGATAPAPGIRILVAEKSARNGAEFLARDRDLAMKKLFAYAACLLAGALIFLPHSDAKPMGPGGFKPKPWAFKHHGFHKHHFAHHHHHRFARNFFFFPGYVDYPYVEPVVVEVPSDDVTGRSEPRQVSVLRAPHGGCSTEEVTVPAASGGEKTVRVTRC